MAYLGRQRSETTPSVLRATYTGDGSTTTYALPGSVANEQSIIATINGVTQQDAAYSTNGSQIIFSSAPASGDAIEIRVISTVGLSYAPSAGSVTTPILADGAITGAKIANAAVSDALIAGVSASKVSGTLTSGNMPAGSVIQVVNSDSTLNFSTSSTSYVDTGFSVAITPSSASNKVMVIYTGNWSIQASNTSLQLALYRDATSTGYYADIYSASSGWLAGQATFATLDSPATTSAITYKLYVKEGALAGTISSNLTKHTLIAMEIAA